MENKPAVFVGGNQAKRGSPNEGHGQLMEDVCTLDQNGERKKRDKDA